MTDKVVEKEVTQDEAPIKSESEVQPEWIDRKKWELDQRLMMRQEFEKSYEIWKLNDLQEVEKKNQEIIKEGLEKLYEKYKEEQKPPTPEDIAVLLNQEYETFPVKLQVEDPTGQEDPTTELFTIRELPQSVEIKFYRQFKDKIIDKATELQAFTQESIDMPFETKVRSILEVFGESFDMLAETVTIVLNPFGKRKVKRQDIDRVWVQNDISSNRQWSIVEAQLKVNRVKDFFSRISSSGQQTQMMMSGVNYQQLQQLVR